MRQDGRLFDALHALLHLAEHPGPMTSQELARKMRAHPVFVRRTLAGLREEGYVRSEKGRGGGWTLGRALSKVTVRDVHAALGSPALLSVGRRPETFGCRVERWVDAALQRTYREAEERLLSRLGEFTLEALRTGVREG